MDRQEWTNGGRNENFDSGPSIVPQLSTWPGAGESARTEVVNFSLTSDDLEDAFAIAQVGVWRWRVGSEVFQWSAEVFRMAGRDPHSFAPTLSSTLECVHPDDRTSLRETLEEPVRGAPPLEREIRIVRPDGSVCYCWAKIGYVMENDHVVALQGILLDTTGRRQSELALKAAEEQHRDIVELSPHIWWTADPAGNIVTVSGRWTAITGLPKAAALGGGLLNHLHEDDYASAKRAIDHSLAQAAPLDVKARLKCANGDLRWIRNRALPKLDAAGCILRWNGLTEDVHEQEQAAADLRECEEHHRYTLEFNPQIPWTADSLGNIADPGGRWRELVGTEPQNWASAVHPEDLARTLNCWSHSLRTGEPVDVRYRLRLINGGYRWFRARARARRSAAVQVVRWYGLLEDIDEQVIAEATLREREDWIRQAHEAAGAGLFEIDFDGGFAKLSAQSLVLHGRAPDSTAIFPGESWSELVRPEDGPRAWEAIEYAIATGETYDFTFGVPTADGTIRWINGLGRVQYNADGNRRRLLGINFDVSPKRAVEAALAQSEALNRSIVDASPDSIELISTSGEVLFANQACYSAMEMTPEIALIGRNWIDLWPAGAQPSARQALAKAVGGEIGRFVAPRATACGRAKWWDVLVSPVSSGSAEPLRLVTIARDITEQKAAEDRAHWSATHDPLTHLPNRRLLDVRIAEAVSEAEAAGEGLAVFVLDLDQFKQINDTLGHDAGDVVLRTLADRLRNAVRLHDTVARLGGDEFALILPGISDAAEATALAQELHIRLREPVIYAGASLDCRASIGASIYPQDGTSASDLLKHADIALYSAKAKRRGELLIFAPHMRAELQERVSMINIARDVLRDRRIRPFYQPKVDLRTGCVAGFEALARWSDHSGNVHLPVSIAAAFDDPDVSAAITDRMLQEIVRQMREWHDQGVEFGHVALNASAADFQRADFGEVVLRQLQKGGIDPRQLQIEVTENVFLARAADVVEKTLDLLSTQGVTIALDDFGTGYASLSHLNRFPVNVIKIDRSFVSDLNSSGHAAAIAEAVITLGRNLNLDVVAEGIESGHQAERLLDLGCPFGQGFLFSAAVPAELVPRLTSQRFEF